MEKIHRHSKVINVLNPPAISALKAYTSINGSLKGGLPEYCRDQEGCIER